jgi:hypothetical protein
MLSQSQNSLKKEKFRPFHEVFRDLRKKAGKDKAK